MNGLLFSLDRALQYHVADGGVRLHAVFGGDEDLKVFVRGSCLQAALKITFHAKRPSNSVVLARGCTQTRYVCLAGVSDCRRASLHMDLIPGVAVAIIVGNDLTSAAGASIVSLSSCPALGRASQKAEQLPPLR